MQESMRPADLGRELEQVESEVRAFSRRPLTSRADGARLVALAAREYEILEALSRPWRRPAASPQRRGDALHA